MELSNDLDSMYAAYRLEFENVHTVQIPYVGFANYKFEDSNSIYVQEVYVIPEARGQKIAAELTDMCIAHAQKTAPIKTVFTSIGLGGNTIDSSIRAITEYGFKLLSANESIIYFHKEISS